ncbi:unnamed protein product [Adineta steineri]|uniref:G-protein coupled receptors family 1 profile domain-containing protein n=1 Tax=Adineta steineri TaxID=433720 RepID=A0A814YH88_9BILA|nr:unnamed protein product [Adineta steineri]CAF1361977.1 unnamed protein product [Adineta steineri]
MFTRYWCITIFVIGFFGHSLNLCIFTRRTLRYNPCVRYLMASAIGGYLIIFILIPIRTLQFGYGLSLFLSSEITCKIMSFVCSWIRMLSCWFLALASVDRFFCSSTSSTLRRLSSLRVSLWLIPSVTIFIGITQIPILIFFKINAQPRICLGQPNLFQKVNGILIIIMWSLIPSLAMLIFGFLTVRHIRQSAQRAAGHKSGNRRKVRIKTVDRQLIQITLTQSILFGITSATGAIGGMFNIIDNGSRKDPLTLAKQSLTGNILSFIGLLSPCISFYICTLSSQLFRRELKNIFYTQQ